MGAGNLKEIPYQPVLACRPISSGWYSVMIDVHKDCAAVIVADSSKNPVNVTFLNPKVRMLGDDAAVITYYRIVQSLNRCVCVGHNVRACVFVC